jgi:hypothetical protein
MICYKTELTNEEVLAINGFWSFSDEENKEFKFTVHEIDRQHKAQAKRAVMSLIKNSFYYVDLPGFVCECCRLISPATSRADYKRRMSVKGSVPCNKCTEELKRKQIENAEFVLDQFRSETLKPRDYLRKLTAVELMALLGVLSKLRNDDQFLGDSYQSISITNVEALDGSLLASLVEKGALIYIQELPSDVKRANDLLHPVNNNVTYYDQNRNFEQDAYNDPGSLRGGIYLNLPVLDNHVIPFTSIDSALYQQLNLQSFTINDSQLIHQIVKHVQSEKLYFLLRAVEKEYRIAIDHSRPLAALLDHLVDNYTPLYLYFTFNVMARDTAAYLYKESANPFAAKHYFTSKVGKYIQYIESKGLSLDKTWSLPVELDTSFFEAFFSQAYLNGHFDWNNLSAKEVVSLWLENVTLAEETKISPVS